MLYNHTIPTVGTLVSGNRSTSVTITVTDAAGNSATCNTSFTVTDNTNPVIVTCAPAQSLLRSLLARLQFRISQQMTKPIIVLFQMHW
ncbi:MAG: hypothetical protein IPH88_19585 [Bacteroidales bacterium]|nr:hypothetical protein [Bacteroidales bacterium]